MGEKLKPGVPESEFYMWRAVFAFSLVDNVLSLEEQTLLQSYLNAVPFSQDQLAILKSDFKKPQPVEAFYQKITEKKDKQRFCILARALVWCEGDMDKQEQMILKHVGCLGSGADDDMLKSTRNHADLGHYHRHYAKAGVAGLFKHPPGITIHI